MFPSKPLHITDNDISWASRLLGLPADAFTGSDGSDPRQDVIKSLQSIDVAACPGSGKTTLLVAKLAILAEQWQPRTRGICVLSHTNVARDEIETSLGNTTTGQRLLSYPHYIGTIHGFVNEFLALPILRSRGITGTQFSTDISGLKIWKLSGYGSALPKFIYRKITDPDERKSAVHNTHYVGEDLDLQLGTVKLLSRKKSEAFEQIWKWKRQVLRDGYAAFEDTFAFGHWALKEHPYLASTLRDRFPLLFVDEAQDNSEDQSVMLHRIFLNGVSNVILQRFGDENQAIFDSTNAKGAEQDKFPSSTIKDLPNSHRFGPQIARLANNLAVVPIPSGLKGHGPRSPLASGLEAPHTIFLFEKENARKVLDAYGALLVRTFSNDELESGIFTAVGQVHRAPEKEEPHKHPHHVGHYWPQYDPELTKRDPKPQHFVQYVFLGLGRAEVSGEFHSSVEKIAEAFLHLIRMTQSGKGLPHRRQSHRQVLELLETNPNMGKRYKELVVTLTASEEPLTKEIWELQLRPIVRDIAESAASASLSPSEAEDFLTWKDQDANAAQESPSALKMSRDNLYRYPLNSPKISIRVGSIHSVKGQTHTATLVLETFWYKHNLEKLKPWILGLRSGWGKKDGVDQEKRLKLHYVAVTRPTHLLCLAMSQSSFVDMGGTLDPKQMLNLKSRGWHVEIV